MKTPTPHLLLPAGVFALILLSSCSSERMDGVWQKIDPAGYKHAHSESFNGARALQSPRSKMTPANDEMALELD